MKKYLILLLVLLVSVSAFSQNAVGFRAGLNIANVTTDPSFTTDARTGFVGGGYGELGVGNDLFVTAELLYLQGGFTMTFSGVDVTQKIDEFSIPISLKYKFAIPDSKFKPYGFIGGSVGFIVKAEVEAAGVTADDKAAFESTDFGIHFGAGLDYEIQPGMFINFDARYSLGLADIDKSSEGKMKSNGIIIMAGLNFGI
jgi:opacity protein-like surface antigen